MKISNSKYGVILATPGFILIIALVVFPLLTLFIVSFLRYTAVDPITFIGFGNFRHIFNDRLLWLSIEKSWIYAGGVTALTLCGGIILAMLLSKVTRGSRIFTTLAMFSWAIPLVISGFMFRWIFNPHVGIFSYFLMTLGIIDQPLSVFADGTLAMIAVIIADAWVRIPFLAILVLAAVMSIPRELYDAAKIDGVNCIDFFKYITLPLCRGQLLIGLLIISMISFRCVDVILAMTGGGPGRATYTLSLYIIDQLWLGVNYGTGSAAGVIMLLLILSFASFCVYQIVKRG